MTVKKIILGKLERCYCVAPLQLHKKPHFMVAAENQNACYLFTQDGEKVDTLWKGPGGVMSMVQVPGSDGQFLATQKFYSPDDSQEAKIVVVTPDGVGHWKMNVLVSLPFVHRFDILQSDKNLFLIACTVKSENHFKDDWTSPGKVYVARMEGDLTRYHEDRPLQLTMLKDQMPKNHGYSRWVKAGREMSVISCENGVFLFSPPTREKEAWNIYQLLSEPASDALLADLDGDGREELAVIAPFHGNQIKIFKEIEGIFTQTYVYPQEAEFAHGICCGKVRGKMTLFIGHRAGKRDLLAFTYDPRTQTYQCELIDHGCGPANVLFFEKEKKGYLVSANREINEIAMYELS